MKKNNLVICILLLIGMAACGDNSEKELAKPPSPEPKGPAPDRVALKATLNDSEFFDYEGIRIGEYLWMTNNIYAPVVTTLINNEQIDKQLKMYNLSYFDYPVMEKDFNRYYGQYFSFEYIRDKFVAGKLFVYENGSYESRWKIPSKQDFRQLFGMCGDGTSASIRNYLMPKAGGLPVLPTSTTSKNEDYAYWYSNSNTNTYKFNMLMSGARYHVSDLVGHSKGDLIELFVMARWATDDRGNVLIDANMVNTNGGELWWWKNVRYCRRLTDSELGYKLYINTVEKDIRKLNSNTVAIIKTSLTDNAPSGYVELAKGYLRGFYVQYILDKPNPSKTISEIVNLAKDRGDM